MDSDRHLRALEMAANKLFTVAGGDRNDKPNILIVLTDGKTNRGSKPYPEVLQPLQVSTSCKLHEEGFVSRARPPISLLQETQFQIAMKHGYQEH